MPEHAPDPIRELENFGTGGPLMSPLPPAQVRRLGDRRRARRTTGLVALSVVAVLAALSPVVLLANRGSDTPSPGPLTSTPSPTSAPTTTAPTTPPPSNTASPSIPQTITYPGGVGVTVATAADAAKLTGTSVDFKTFIAGRAAADAASCAGTQHGGVTVKKYSSAGYASGGVTCGGYQALWVQVDGTWGEGQGTQDTWDCDALAYLHVPASFAAGCADESGIFGTAGTGQPEPGMTRAEAQAAGVTITSDAAAPPCVSTEYSAPALPTQNNQGLFSPSDGLVQVTMTTNMKTEKKIGLGSLSSKVRAAYPSGHTDGGDFWIVPRPGGTTFLIRFGADDRVSRFTWALDRADCADYLM